MANFWDTYEETTKEESGGGGIVGKCRVDMGYKVYVGGTTQEESFFAVTDPAKKGDAKTRATQFAKEHNAARGPQWGIQIRVAVDGAYSAGHPATWSQDRFFNTDAWTSAAKELVVPHLKELGLALPWEGWARIGFAPDPYEVQRGEMKDEDQEGNPRYTPRAYVSEVFANQEEAMAAVGSSGDDATDTTSVVDSIPGMGVASPEFPIPMPDGYDVDSWKIVLDDVAAQEGTPPVVAKYVEENYGFTLKPADLMKIRHWAK